MTTWVKEHFSDAQHSMTTVSLAALAAGVVGFVIVVVSVILSK